VLDRALTRDPDLGRHGPARRHADHRANLRSSLPSHGTVVRDRLRRLAVAPDIDWVDFQSRHDIMNFLAVRSGRGHGIHSAGTAKTRTSSPSASATFGRKKG